MDIFAKLAEEKIKEAINRGELDNLPGQGKPLELEDLSHVPPDLRMGYRILKNAGVLPEELALQQEIVTLRDLLATCLEEEARQAKERELREKTLKFNLLMEKRGINAVVLNQYSRQLSDKLK